MHSLIQAQNITGVVVDWCTVKSKNGINLNSSSNVEIKNSTIEVNGYAVRAGVSGGSSGDITLTNNTLKTDNSEGDAVIVIRGTAAEQINLSMSKNVVSGATHISGTTAKTQVSADANYWDGKAYPVVKGTEVKVNNYYPDEAKSNLVNNHFGGSIVGLEMFGYFQRNILNVAWIILASYALSNLTVAYILKTKLQIIL